MKKSILLTLLAFFFAVTPARATQTVEDLAVGSYVSFSGQLWQKLDYYGETNGLTKCNSTTAETTSTCDARTYLILTPAAAVRAFDTRFNNCTSNNSGWNDFSASELNAWLNDASAGFASTLTHLDWIIARSDWSIVDQFAGAVGNPAKQPGDECTMINSGTAPATFAAQIAIASYAEMANRSPAIDEGNDALGTAFWWLRTPNSGIDIGGAGANGAVARTAGLGGAGSSHPVFMSDAIVRPSIHLQADLLVLGGDGTMTDPYCIHAEECPALPPSENTIVNLHLSGFLSLNCTNHVDLFLPSGYGETERDMTCNVLTNNTNGYTISVDSSDNLDNNGNTIPALGNNSSVPAALTQTGTGARWAITNDMSSSHFGSNVWFSSGQISSSNTASANTGDNYTYRVGASVGANSILLPGTYTGTLTFTATTID